MVQIIKKEQLPVCFIKKTSKSGISHCSNYYCDIREKCNFSHGFMIIGG